MKALNKPYIITFVVLVFGFLSGNAWATPQSQALYWEYDLGGGLWKYDYIFYNTSDPITDPGYDVYDFFLYFNPVVTITNILSPPDWEFNSDFSSFIDWYSISPGEPPTGADIAPGTFLTGFSFKSNMQLAFLAYDACLTNPSGEPIHYSGNITPVPVPEPASVFLIGSGLVGLAGIRRRLRKQKQT